MLASAPEEGWLRLGQMGTGPGGDPQRPSASQDISGFGLHANAGPGGRDPPAGSVLERYNPSVCLRALSGVDTFFEGEGYEGPPPYAPVECTPPVLSALPGRHWPLSSCPPHWTYSNRLRRLATVSGHGHLPAWCVTHDHSGRVIATGADDGLVKIWSARTGLLEVRGDPLSHFPFSVAITALSLRRRRCADSLTTSLTSP